MKLIIVVTAPFPGYRLWEMTEKWQEDQVLEETKVRVAGVGHDKIVVLCQADSRVKGDSDRERDIRAKTTPWVLGIANSPLYGAADKVYLAAHSGYVDLKRVRAGVAKEKRGAYAFFNHSPDPPHSDEIYRALYKLIPDPDEERFAAAVAAITSRQGLTHAQRLSGLKHRLAHLFLPISVDLHAWRGFDFDDEYMREIINSYREDEGRLSRARELLYGAGQPPDADSVEKIVKEARLEESPCWRKVVSLLPRKEPDTEAEKRDAPGYSEVFQTQDVLGSLKNKDKLRALKEVLTKDNPFNSWYVELETALIELRNQMET